MCVYLEWPKDREIRWRCIKLDVCPKRVKRWGKSPVNRERTYVVDPDVPPIIEFSNFVSRILDRHFFFFFFINVNVPYDLFFGRFSFVQLEKAGAFIPYVVGSEIMDREVDDVRFPVLKIF